MERKWSMREYRKGDEEGIFELWKITYPTIEVDRESWMKRWYWMYRENPAGVGKIWLAEHRDKIVGQYAVVPRLIKVSDRVIGGALSLQTMTHPDYRRQKIFEMLANKVYDEAKKNNIFIIIGFPNRYSYPGLINRLNWYKVSGMHSVIRVINWKNFLKTKTNNKLLLHLGKLRIQLVDKVFHRQGKKYIEKNLDIIQAFSFDERINEFWDIVSEQYQIMPMRSKEYLNWRYVSPPTVNYKIYLAEKKGQICGYLVLRCSKMKPLKEFVIVDLLANSVKITQHLISKAVEDCYHDNADVVLCSMIANKTYFKTFRKNSFNGGMHLTPVTTIYCISYFRPSADNRLGGHRINCHRLLDEAVE